MRTPLPLHLVLAGGASLGAFHGGALSAMLTGLRPLAAAGAVRIDAVGGTSAGAIAALLAAHAWLQGIDPVWLLREAWVERLSTDLLRTKEAAAPFSFERLRQRIDEILDPTEDGQPTHRVQPAQAPLVLVAHLVNLHGLTYDLDVSGDRTGTTYDDWTEHVLQPGGGIAQLRSPEGRSPLDAVLASASNPAAFGPALLDRTEDLEAYRRNGIVGLPERPTFWYSDGGPLTAQPVGRVVKAGRALRENDPPGTPPGDRMVVVLDPRSEGPTDQSFTGSDDPPSWLSALSRVLAILPAQSISTDVRRINDHNERLATTRAVADVLADHVDDDTRRQLSELVNEHRPDVPGVDPLPQDATIHEVLATVAGVGGKSHVVCDVISPSLRGQGPAPAHLSGDLLGDFGGFLSRRHRRNDFALGYACAKDWLEERALQLADGDESVAEDAWELVAAAEPTDGVDDELARSGLASLLPESATRAARVASAILAGAARRGVSEAARVVDPRRRG